MERCVCEIKFVWWWCWEQSVRRFANLPWQLNSRILNCFVVDFMKIIETLIVRFDLLLQKFTNKPENKTKALKLSSIQTVSTFKILFFSFLIKIKFKFLPRSVSEFSIFFETKFPLRKIKKKDFHNKTFSDAWNCFCFKGKFEISRHLHFFRLKFNCNKKPSNFKMFRKMCNLYWINSVNSFATLFLLRFLQEQKKTWQFFVFCWRNFHKERIKFRSSGHKT